MRRFFRLNPAGQDRKYCFVKGGHGYAVLQQGGPILARMKEDGIDALEYQLDESKGGLKVGDYFRTATNHLPVSRRFAEALTSTFNPGAHELIPARVRNEKKRIHADDVLVVNPLNAVDCLDWDRSQLDGDVENPMVRVFGKWSIKAERVPANLDLFRVKGLIGYLFSERLVEFIRNQKFEGFAFDEAPQS